MKVFLIILGVLILIVAIFAGVFYFNQKKINATPIDYSTSGPVTSEPASLTLEVSSPADDTLVFDSSQIVSGNTAPNANILISSDSGDSVISSKADGSFSTIFDLSEGLNNLSIVVFDKSGDSRIINRTVYYSKEKI